MAAISALLSCLQQSTFIVGASLDMIPWRDLYLGKTPSDLTVTRTGSSATDRLFTDPAGTTFDTYAANTLRRKARRGWVTDAAKTQYLGDTASPATQTTASLGTGSYCLWVSGSGSATASGGTATITGAAAASQGVYNSFTVTVAGTVVVTTSGVLDIFQLENGAEPTSYIPNAGPPGTTVARGGDLISLTGAAFSDWYTNAAASTIYAEFEYPGAVVSFPRIFSLSDGTTSNLIELVINAASDLRGQIITGGATVLASNFTIGTTPGAVHCLAMAGASADRAVSTNHMPVNSNTTAGAHPTVDRAHIGNRFDSARPYSGVIRRIACIPSRAINGRLQVMPG